MEKNICIVVPIKTSLLNTNATYIAEINDEKPEFVELRFDFIDKIETLTIKFINKLKNMINQEISTIFTFRDYSEGGNISISKEERLKLLKTLINAHPDYIDIELNTEATLLNEAIKDALKNNVKIIFSYHDLLKTPNYDDAIELIKMLEDKLIKKTVINLDSLVGYIFDINFLCRIRYWFLLR